MPKQTKSTDKRNHNSRRQRRQQSYQNANPTAQSNVQPPKDSVSNEGLEEENRDPQIIEESSSTITLSSNMQRSHSNRDAQVTIPNDPLLLKEIQRIVIVGACMIAILIILQFLI
jgi:hypothetical protein